MLTNTKRYDANGEGGWGQIDSEALSCTARGRIVAMTGRPTRAVCTVVAAKQRDDSCVVVVVAVSVFGTLRNIEGSGRTRKWVSEEYSVCF